MAETRNSRASDVHNVYKRVVNDSIGVDQGMQELRTITWRKPQFSNWSPIPMGGIVSAIIAALSFQGRWIDMPIAFLLGSILTTMRLRIARRNELYRHLLKLWQQLGGDLSCFAAVAQSSMIQILPGLMVLTAMMELQTRKIITGSTRLIFAFIYTQVLGYSIGIGTSLYALIDPTASVEIECLEFDWCPNRWHSCKPICPQCDTPGKKLVQDGRFARCTLPIIFQEEENALKGSESGIMHNESYERGHQQPRKEREFDYALAGAVMVPAIFVQVSNDLAANGSLLEGVKTATALAKILQGVPEDIDIGDDILDGVSEIDFDILASVIQVAISVTIGLGLGALIVYPLGKSKKKSGLRSWLLVKDRCLSLTLEALDRHGVISSRPTYACCSAPLIGCYEKRRS
ncbi:hypothetical protein BKA67DRAFT_542237 [Truncatella angustata]|uniref:Threonine/serine exporter-like N-terminal domain-containing protein n=1 Tax=Truncatella angustata TaxID=152316 RepID=A0A9P8UBM0_9PEZI|nr:uncharacterized protein BKA67DRAFT_542237 [Truncatella angustata]KAH6643276.1 hypothetical protein BKA67DRAFT_542237 [Truncatella angustata]